jgi:hypothetical protein
MCLQYKELSTKRLRNKMTKAGGEMTFWKILRRFKRANGGRGLQARYQRTKYKTGVNIARMETRRVGLRLSKGERGYGGSGFVYHGIHVFTRRPNLPKHNFRTIGLRVVPFTCNVKHLRAAGSWNEKGSAVFTQVRLKGPDYRAALKGRVKF